MLLSLRICATLMLMASGITHLAGVQALRYCPETTFILGCFTRILKNLNAGIGSNLVKPEKPQNYEIVKQFISP